MQLLTRLVIYNMVYPRLEVIREVAVKTISSKRNIAKRTLKNGIETLYQKKIVNSLSNFRKNNGEVLNNYKPISMLPCFSKLSNLYKTYNRFYKYLSDSTMLLENGIGVKTAQSTEYVFFKLKPTSLIKTNSHLPFSLISANLLLILIMRFL